MDKRVLLIIGGGIAAYKSLELIRTLQKRSIGTRGVLTKAGAEFVTPLSVSALSGEKTYTDLFSLTDEVEMGHIELSRSADLVVVAPATADLIGKAANGLANDLASTALLATDKPVLMAPAMNVRMWEHAAVQRNVKTLKGDGVMLVGPDEGAMACGEFGYGRMAEPDAIADRIEDILTVGPVPTDLEGRHVLLTAGPTREAIDPVRYLSNHSSGKQGYALAGALAARGARVTLVSGPVDLPVPPGVTRRSVETAQEMHDVCEAELPADVFVGVAAVADWRPTDRTASKLKKDQGVPDTLKLTENPDILASIATHAQRPRLVIGFAAETDRVIDHAKAKLAKKRIDWIIANDVSGDVMGGDHNAVHLITADGVDALPPGRKRAVAARLAAHIAASLNA